jgi:hypothetical protein
LWDTRALIFVLDLDYQNLDHAAEPFLRPTDVFFKLENSYAASCRILRRAGLHSLTIATGRGYHFVGRIPLDDPAVDALATLASLPAWYDGYLGRRPSEVRATMSQRQATAAAGLSLLLEYLAHAILREAARSNLIPIVLNGTTVGAGLVGRECVSIDFSHAGDPLDQRHMRIGFGAHQWHRARPDIFGDAAALPPLVALPRPQRLLEDFLLAGRDLPSAQRVAGVLSNRPPDLADGIKRVIDRYRTSPLAQFHSTFAAERRAQVSNAPPAIPGDLPPCIARTLRSPNDLLLKPEYLQNLVRGLLARGWTAAQVAALVQHEYERDHGWGDRWLRLDPRTRADFDVRVFAGLIVTGADRLLDFNCASSQDKDLCPRSGCRHDLRADRELLMARYAS